MVDSLRLRRRAEDPGSLPSGSDACLAQTRGAIGDGFGVVAEHSAVGGGGPVCALARRNSDQVGPLRRGAGPSPELRKTVAIVVAETLIPSFSSSPWMRT